VPTEKYAAVAYNMKVIIAESTFGLVKLDELNESRFSEMDKTKKLIFNYIVDAIGSESAKRNPIDF